MHPNWKGRSKIISAYDMIFYAEKTKDYTDTHTLRELINEFIKQKDKEIIGLHTDYLNVCPQISVKNF